MSKVVLFSKQQIFDIVKSDQCVIYYFFLISYPHKEDPDDTSGVTFASVR